MKTTPSRSRATSSTSTPTSTATRCALYFHRLLRREQQFQSAVELTNQIRMDIDRSRRYFLRHPVRYDEAGYSFP